MGRTWVREGVTGEGVAEFAAIPHPSPGPRLSSAMEYYFVSPAFYFMLILQLGISQEERQCRVSPDPVQADTEMG